MFLRFRIFGFELASRLAEKKLSGFRVAILGTVLYCHSRRSGVEIYPAPSTAFPGSPRPLKYGNALNRARDPSMIEDLFLNYMALGSLGLP